MQGDQISYFAIFPTVFLVIVCNFSYVNNFFGSVSTVDPVHILHQNLKKSHYSPTHFLILNSPLSRNINKISPKINRSIFHTHINIYVFFNWENMHFGANYLWMSTIYINTVHVCRKLVCFYTICRNLYDHISYLLNTVKYFCVAINVEIVFDV